MYIRGRGKIGYLIGEKKEPAPEDSTYPMWEAENSMVMTWLVNSMEEDISSNHRLTIFFMKEILLNLCKVLEEPFFSIINISLYLICPGRIGIRAKISGVIGSVVIGIL